MLVAAETARKIAPFQTPPLFANPNDHQKRCFFFFSVRAESAGKAGSRCVESAAVWFGSAPSGCAAPSDRSEGTTEASRACSEPACCPSRPAGALGASAAPEDLADGDVVPEGAGSSTSVSGFSASIGISETAWVCPTRCQSTQVVPKSASTQIPDTHQPLTPRNDFGLGAGGGGTVRSGWGTAAASSSAAKRFQSSGSKVTGISGSRCRTYSSTVVCACFFIMRSSR